MRIDPVIRSEQDIQYGNKSKYQGQGIFNFIFTNSLDEYIVKYFGSLLKMYHKNYEAYYF